MNLLKINKKHLLGMTVFLFSCIQHGKEASTTETTSVDPLSFNLALKLSGTNALSFSISNGAATISKITSLQASGQGTAGQQTGGFFDLIPQDGAVKYLVTVSADGGQSCQSQDIKISGSSAMNCSANTINNTVPGNTPIGNNSIPRNNIGSNNGYQGGINNNGGRQNIGGQNQGGFNNGNLDGLGGPDQKSYGGKKSGGKKKPGEDEQNGPGKLGDNVSETATDTGGPGMLAQTTPNFNADQAYKDALEKCGGDSSKLRYGPTVICPSAEEDKCKENQDSEECKAKVLVPSQQTGTEQQTSTCPKERQSDDGTCLPEIKNCATDPNNCDPFFGYIDPTSSSTTSTNNKSWQDQCLDDPDCI